MCKKMNEALEFLRDKYGFPAGEITAQGKKYILRLADGSCCPLLPWRVERRFVELKKIIDGQTLENVSTFRFAHFSAEKSLEELLAAELDLMSFLGDSPIISIFSVVCGDATCNALVRLANGMSGSIECGTKLPAGKSDIDRHEIIAARGVASDRVADTQVPQESIYMWNEAGETCFTDVDTELFGLPNNEIWVVRAAYAVLADTSLAETWKAAAKAMQTAVAAAFESNNTKQPVILA